MPNPLPPQIDYDEELSALISSAALSLGELSGLGVNLTNPNLLIVPYMKQEAVLSSKIENTVSTLDDLYRFEFNKKDKILPPDVQEVSNYVEAMLYGFEQTEKLALSLRLVRDLHKKLMEGVRGSQKRPGQFRNSQVYIGGTGPIEDATFVPPPPFEMKSALEEWEKYIHAESRISPLIQCAIMHYQFEAIHPFNDGNGRLGRLMISLFLLHKKCLSKPLLFMSKYFEQTRQEYYRCLQEVSAESNWRQWLCYFLKGVDEQCKRNTKNAKEIIDLHKKCQSLLEAKDVKARLFKILDKLFLIPLTNVLLVRRLTNMSAPTAQSDLDTLEEVGILKKTASNSRPRYYVFEELRRILNN